jgi:hypothetical protein
MTRVYRRADRVVWRRSADRVLVWPAGADDPLLLEGPGSVSWELLHEPLDEDELVTALASLYEEDVEEVRRDLDPFLEELVTTGAVART